MSPSWYSAARGLSLSLGDERARCEVCPHACTLRAGQIGRCRVRIGDGAAVVPVAGQKVLASGVAAVEQHPFFHFYPGSRSLGLGAAGCSAACDYCQNWELALAPRLDPAWNGAGRYTNAEAVAAAAARSGCSAVAFTYNEPTVWPELIIDVAQAARASGLHVLAISNGFITGAARALLLPSLDALKIDLKLHDAELYRRQIGVDLAPVLETLADAVAAGVWCEISTVIVPGVNDTAAAIDIMAEHILQAAGPAVPWHLLRFFPAYLRDSQPPGELAVLRLLRGRAQQHGLKFVYISNVPHVEESSTCCPTCGTLLARRRAAHPALLTERCLACGEAIPGRGLAPLTVN